MDSRIFVKELMKEIFEAHEKKRDILPIGSEQEEMPFELLKHWLNFAVYYERAAVAFIGGWIKDYKQPDVIINFAHQIEDEANHYVWLKRHLDSFNINHDEFSPPEEWRYLMEEYYPSLPHLVERLAAHNIASETGVLGFMEFNLNKFPPDIKKTVDKVYKDEKYHVTFGKQLLIKYCINEELQKKAREATYEALSLMQKAREIFVLI